MILYTKLLLLSSLLLLLLLTLMILEADIIYTYMAWKQVLQLDLCGQPTLDLVLGKTIAPASNSLPNLAILSLRGACRMSDKAMEILVTSAPSLQSIDLGQCSLLTHTSIDIAANSLGSMLKELYIDDCESIDAMLILPALEKLEHLEVLSVAGIHSICDQFVSELLTARAQNFKELDFADCQ